jgi:predicted nucleotidyltransferase
LAPDPSPPLALTADQRALVARIVRETLADAQAYAFGSRATGRARAYSDLDLLVVRQQPLSLAERAALRDRFERSELPFRVDIVEQAGLSGPTAERIARERVRL